ncbi:MAG: hypothetical protein ACOYB1_10545 [Limnohabitans sp.]
MSNTLEQAPFLWVGLWHKRHVVFDPSIQPVNQKFMLLYFVQGKALCVRDREVDRKTVRTVRDQYEIEFALDQYSKWLLSNRNIVEDKRSCLDMVAENPPPSRRKCSQCDGQGNWHYTVGTFSDGAHSDGVNVSERCSLCDGRGFVDDVIEF